MHNTKLPTAQPAAARQTASTKRLRTRVRVLHAAAAALAIGTVATSAYADTPASTVDLNQFGISGAWYDPASTGQGLVISVMPDADGQHHASYFGGWFTFADHWSGEWYQQALGTPMWLTLQGDTSHVDPTIGVRLAIYDNDGRNGNLVAPPAVPASQLGWAYLSMVDCNHMHLHYTVQWRADFVDPQWQEMDLKRLMPNVSCVDATTQPTAPPPGANFSAAWYDPATSGQGFAFEVNPASSSSPGRQALFGGWFTYAAASINQAGKGRRWYTLQGDVAWGQIEFLLPEYLYGSVGIYETTGGTFAMPNPPATLIRTQRVGTATIKFGTSSGSPYADGFSCASAYLSYYFDAGENAGRGGSISLQRLGPSPATCGLPGE